LESGRGSLAGVDEFPLGDSPEGVRQLCGNVWEWVTGSAGRFEIRGGSYQTACELWGLAYAFRQTDPKFSASDVGFRVVTY
jgi:formylglycine-generating enzyme required for sulfatase activity